MIWVVEVYNFKDKTWGPAYGTPCCISRKNSLFYINQYKDENLMAKYRSSRYYHNGKRP